jgi:very-short-patch-repair endonuclease
LIKDKILIELDGNFWHSTEKQKRLDEEFESLAFQCGYDILRFTDQEIKKTKGKCFERINESK